MKENQNQNQSPKPDPQASPEPKSENSVQDALPPDPQLDKNLSELFKTQESQPETKESSTPTPVSTPTETKPINLPDPESFKAPQKLKSEEAVKGWNALKDSYFRARTLLRDRDDEITKLKSIISSSTDKTKAEVDALKNELKRFEELQAVVDIQTDREFIKNFDEPIQNLENQITQKLKEWKVSDETISKIDFSDPETVDLVLEAIEENVNKTEARMLSRKAEELIGLYEKRNEKVDEWSKNYKAYIEKKRQEILESQTQYQVHLDELKQQVFKSVDNQGNPSFPFLSKLEVKPDLNRMQLDHIEKHNKVVDSMRLTLDQLLQAEKPEERVSIAVAALGAKWLSWERDALLKKVKSLENELSKVSQVSSETRDGNVLKPQSTNNNLDLDVALAESFPGMR